MNIDWQLLFHASMQALIFSVVGLILFGVSYLAIAKITPFSIRKELEDDHNTALALILGAIIIGIALIVSASVRG